MDNKTTYYALKLSHRPGNDNITYCRGTTLAQSHGAVKRATMRHLGVRTHKAAVKLLKRRARL